MNSCVLYVNKKIASEPKSGEAIVDNWWVVHPEHGLAFSCILSGRYKSSRPHAFCSEHKDIIETTRDRAFGPPHVIEKIPVVFCAQAIFFMEQVQEEAGKTQNQN
jgi:hypothetical protein